MSWSRRALLILPLLAACGFTPVYGPDGSGTKLRNQVRVQAPINSDEYVLVRHLEQRLGRADNPRYHLDYTLSVTQRGLAIDTEGDTTRYNVTGTATYSLRDASGTVVLSGEVDSFEGYSATGSTVVTKASREDARKRLSVVLADQIVEALYTRLDLP